MLVPRVDADGNELGGVPVVLRDAPLGTYLGWNITGPGFHKGKICNYAGGMIPFATTKAEREKSGDPRLSLEERYGTHAGYVAAVTAAAQGAMATGFLLEADAEGARRAGGSEQRPQVKIAAGSGAADGGAVAVMRARGDWLSVVQSKLFHREAGFLDGWRPAVECAACQFARLADGLPVRSAEGHHALLTSGLAECLNQRLAVDRRWRRASLRHPRAVPGATRDL